ncbi:MAG: acyl-CoA dehydrogenase family protein [Deltaproteobacteria bacterium]|nr:acyl-CoA dehydrogenase family protein [Deltaproteobacteria bacterium]
MSQFALTDEQNALVQSVRRVVKESVAPRAAQIDAAGEFPWDIKELFAELGFFGAGIPEAYGGTDQGLLTVCLMLEEVSKACVTSSLFLTNQELSSTPIKIAGTEAQKQKYLTRLASGEWLGGFCLTEPGAGSDAGSMSTKAIRDANAWVLNGTKCFITHGGVAGLYVVFAKTAQDRGAKGISAFLVEADVPGLKVGKHENKMGVRGSSTAEMIFDDCRVPAGNLLGGEGEGFALAMGTLDRTRAAVGAQGLGIAQGALDFAVTYMQERKQFGRAIASFQGLRWMVADLATEIECARSLVYRAASVVDDELRQGKTRLSADAAKLSAMAKLKGTDVAMRVTTDAVQLAGGYGYMKDYPLERMMRDAKITQIWEGTNQIQREVISSKLFG